MIIQSCPRCGSNRIRRGYRRTPWWWAMFGRYNLLCNRCNWEFAGFAVPGSVPENIRKRQKQDKIDFQLQTFTTKESSVGETQEPSRILDLTDSSNQTIAKIENNLLEVNKVGSKDLLTDLNEVSKAEFDDKIDLKQNLNDRAASQASHQTTKIKISGNPAAVSQKIKVKKRTHRKN